MSIPGAMEQITAALEAWEGVSAHPHRFGGTEYRLGKRELGHIHGDRWLDIPFPTRIRDEIVAAGEAQPHHLLADSGWVSFYLRREGDVEQAIRLLQRSYDLARHQLEKRKG